VPLSLAAKTKPMVGAKYNLKTKLLMSAGNKIYMNVSQRCMRDVADKTYDITWSIFQNQIAHLIKGEINERE
jgi:hypothetical protein